MNNQQLETVISSQDVAAAIGWSWLFDLDPQGKMVYSLFLAAFGIYARFYNESTN